jgi:hypothetical protein
MKVSGQLQAPATLPPENDWGEGLNWSLSRSEWGEEEKSVCFRLEYNSDSQNSQPIV